MSDIFSEVEEDLRRDQMQSLWKRYGGYVVGLALGIVAVTAGTEIYQNQTENARQEAAQRYEAALNAVEAGNEDAAQAALAAIAKDGDDGFAVLANLKRAGLLIEAGQKDEAAAIYESLADEADTPPAIRALANIRATALLFDGLSDDDVRARLEGQSAEGEAFRHGALELLALSALRAGDAERARTHLNSLTLDPGTPPNMRTRAIEVLKVIGDKQGGEEAAPEQAASGEASADEPSGDTKETAQ